MLSHYPAEMVLSQYVPNVTTVGASGAVYGLLLAFAMLFPKVDMYILFIPIPIYARTLVIIYACIELFFGVAGFSFDTIAQFAHLGGMIFGLILLLIWYPELFSGIKFPKIKWPWQKYDRLDSSRDKDYSGYHYQSRVDD